MRHVLVVLVASLGALGTFASACSAPYAGTKMRGADGGLGLGEDELEWDPFGEDAAAPRAPTGASRTPEPADAGDASASPSAGRCSSETTQSKCETCCQTVHAEGAKLFAAEEEACRCAASACRASCEQSYCAGRVTEPRSACADCLTANDDGCFNRALTACQKDAACAAFLACKDSSTCAGKPR